jgi:hypothetical protein
VFCLLESLLDPLPVGLLVGVERVGPFCGEPRQHFPEFRILWPMTHDRDGRWIDVLLAEEDVEIYARSRRIALSFYEVLERQELGIRKGSPGKPAHL